MKITKARLPIVASYRISRLRTRMAACRAAADCKVSVSGMMAPMAAKCSLLFEVFAGDGHVHHRLGEHGAECPDRGVDGLDIDGFVLHRCSSFRLGRARRPPG